MFPSGVALTAISYPHLRLDPVGRAWVECANVKVSEIAADFIAHGSSVEEMAIQFPALTPAMIHSALAYFYDHRDEYEDALSRSLRSYREKADATAQSPLRVRLGKTPGKQ